jgi:hypothetical protein
MFYILILSSLVYRTVILSLKGFVMYVYSSIDSHLHTLNLAHLNSIQGKCSLFRDVSISIWDC